MKLHPVARTADEIRQTLSLKPFEEFRRWKRREWLRVALEETDETIAASLLEKRDRNECTGRTTMMIVHALVAVDSGYEVRFVAGTISYAHEITKNARACCSGLGLDREMILEPMEYLDAVRLRDDLGLDDCLVFVDHNARDELVEGPF